MTNRVSMKALLLIGSVMAMGAVGAVAQADTDATPARAGAGATPAQVMTFLTNRLTLTDDQAAKITPIVTDRQQKLQALRADTSERPMQRMKKAKAVQEDDDKKIKAILTPDQATKYAAIEEQMRDAAKQRQQAKKDAQ